jgi:signal transduction histidine kinase
MGAWTFLRGWRKIPKGLTLRVAAASILLCLLMGGAFGTLLLAIIGLSEATKLARHSTQVVAAANELERLLIDLETGQRGYVISGDQRFLQPWNEARAIFPERAAALEQLAAARHAGQGKRADVIGRDGEAYIENFSVPVVELAERDLVAARTPQITLDGKRRVDAIRSQFDEFNRFERNLSAERNARAASAAEQATVIAVAGVLGSILLVVIFSGYLTRAVVRPVRRASTMAGHLAAGDLTVRMPETGPGEIGRLENSFNTMAGSLQTSRDQLRQIADEQAALRRIATLVARGVPPAEVFRAVATETAGILAVDHTSVQRYESDNSMTVVGSWAAHGDPVLPVGSRWPLEGDSVSTQVLRTGRPTRKSSYDHATGKLAEWVSSRGINSSVGCPIMVEGRLWGSMVAFSAAPRQPDGAEARMVEITELVATAIANSQSRDELTASRARIVDAADAARRRIERDLHDGAQQRLVTLGLDLRIAEADVPPEHEQLKQQLAHTVHGLNEVLGELQEISRGLHPAISSKGGLGAALRALARRSSIPVELTVDLPRQLPERVEVAAYYIASEALTNAAKHARASTVRIDVTLLDAHIRISVHDDGVGGADPSRGTGLIGLKDRVEALGGRIEITSPTQGGTTLLATMPIETE